MLCLGLARVAAGDVLGSCQRVCWAARFHELFISSGREAVINNTLALSHSACMCLQINISFSRNTHRCLLINKNWKMFYWMVLNMTLPLHLKNMVYLVYSTKMLISLSRGCLKCITAAHWARCLV